MPLIEIDAMQTLKSRLETIFPGPPYSDLEVFELGDNCVIYSFVLDLLGTWTWTEITAIAPKALPPEFDEIKELRQVESRVSLDPVTQLWRVQIWACFRE